jgi:hypothetical protein
MAKHNGGKQTKSPNETHVETAPLTNTNDPLSANTTCPHLIVFQHVARAQLQTTKMSALCCVCFVGFVCFRPPTGQPTPAHSQPNRCVKGQPKPARQRASVVVVVIVRRFGSTWTGMVNAPTQRIRARSHATQAKASSEQRFQDKLERSLGKQT